MHFDVHGVPRGEFAAWVDDDRAAAAATLDRRTATPSSRRQSIERDPSTYRLGRSRPVRRDRDADAAAGPGPRRARVRAQSQRAETSDAGQAELGRDPVRPADPADRGRRRRRWSSSASSPGSSLKGWLPYLWREWITSVDHKRIGVMYIAARAGDAAARLHRRDHDALAAGARLPVAGLPAARALRPDLLGARHAS